jgi:hypothetical protein
MQAVFNWVNLARAQLGKLTDDIEYDFSAAASDVVTVPGAMRAAALAATAAASADADFVGRRPSVLGSSQDLLSAGPGSGPSVPGLTSASSVPGSSQEMLPVGRKPLEARAQQPLRGL